MKAPFVLMLSEKKRVEAGLLRQESRIGEERRHGSRFHFFRSSFRPFFSLPVGAM